VKKTVAFISHADCGRHDTGWGHPEHVGRLRAIPRALRNDFELYESLDHLEGRHASAGELALAHDSKYIASVQSLAAQGGGNLDADTLASSGSWDAATSRSPAKRSGVFPPCVRRVITRSVIPLWVFACSETWPSPRITRGR
jgi:acetoin utilization deacetylase AcuC-like enzyme